MLTRILAPLAVLALAACQQLPESRQAPVAAMRSSAELMQVAATGGSSPASGSPYRAAIVKDLDIGDAAPGNLTGVDLADFRAARGELAALFGAAFRETLQREGYVRLALPGDSGADVVTIQPATMRISPGYELEIAVGVRDARGRFLGWYAVQYSGEWRDRAPLSRVEVLRRVFADAGEQAAKAIAKAP